MDQTLMLLDNIAEKTLGNGLKIISLKKTDAPIVSVQVWYKTGSSFEEKGSKGISHFLEHMMFRGSRNVPSEEHARRVNDVGGHSNAFTAEDVTAYTNSVPRDFLDMVFALEADRMDGLVFDPKILETERNVIVEEYHTYMNNPVAKALMEFRTVFYGDHPYATSPLGLIEDVASISADACKEYYRRFYGPDNAVIVAVGDTDASKIFDAAERNFGNKIVRTLQTLEKPINIKHHDREGNRRMRRKVEFDVPVLVIGYPAPPSSHEDAVALEILQLVVAGGETSRLHREVVRRQSLAVMTGGMNHLLKTAGMSMLFAAFTPDIAAGRVERAFDREIKRILTEGITREEMEKVRNTTLTNRTFELYSADNISQRIGYSETIEGNYRLWVERLETLKNLDQDRLVEVARRWWDDTKKYVLFLEPRQSNPLLFIGGILRRIAGFGRRSR
ncbi:MAG: pitrilysin family protein [Chitinispirillaceae bacterium]|jgi:zinc protease